MAKDRARTISARFRSAAPAQAAPKQAEKQQHSKRLNNFWQIVEELDKEEALGATLRSADFLIGSRAEAFVLAAEMQLHTRLAACN